MLALVLGSFSVIDDESSILIMWYKKGGLCKWFTDHVLTMQIYLFSDSQVGHCTPVMGGFLCHSHWLSFLGARGAQVWHGPIQNQDVLFECDSSHHGGVSPVLWCWQASCHGEWSWLLCDFLFLAYIPTSVLNPIGWGQWKGCRFCPALLHVAVKECYAEKTCLANK